MATRDSRSITGHRRARTVPAVSAVTAEWPARPAAGESAARTRVARPDGYERNRSQVRRADRGGAARPGTPAAGGRHVRPGRRTARGRVLRHHRPAADPFGNHVAPPERRPRRGMAPEAAGGPRHAARDTAAAERGRPPGATRTGWAGPRARPRRAAPADRPADHEEEAPGPARPARQVARR